MSYNRRYYLHQQMKAAGFRYHAVCKTIFTPFNKNASNNKHVAYLTSEYNYQIQTEIV
jgi:hypothetical protein